VISLPRRLLRRLRSRDRAKADEELRWWLTEWDPVIRSGGLNPGDVLELLGDERAAETYAGRRWQIARAEVVRVLREAAIEDPGFFESKVVVDIGSGPLGFPSACPARVSISVDPLHDRYAAAGLLLDGAAAIHLSARAERIPLLASSVDVVVTRNALDHVDDPHAVLAEVQRLLKPGGTLIANFDVDHTPSTTEPHSLSVAAVKAALSTMAIEHEELWERPHGFDGRAAVLRARKVA
jgi:ubiquinone/menaquinone biosynthesis C-methylase UbiE